MACSNTDWQRVLDDADDETALLIAKLILEDTSEVVANGTTDEKVAFKLLDDDAKEYIRIRQPEDDEATVDESAHESVVVDTSDTADLETINAKPTFTAGQALFTCDICGDLRPTDGIWRVPCSHYYCDESLQKLFRAAMKDESLYPPRCCNQAIPFDDVKFLLGAELADTFHAKIEELDTKSGRVYCHEPSCNIFLGAACRAGDHATCPECERVTCIHCNKQAHDGECEEDTALQEVLQMCEKEGWQRCNGCKAVVELTVGCNHMTCKCGAQFCYVCGVEWKNCACPQFHEERLYERAQVIADRDGQGHDHAAVLAAARNLERNHECVRHAWARRSGPNTCEECYDVLPTYIFECRRCRTMVCRRCRFNRI